MALRRRWTQNLAQIFNQILRVLEPHAEAEHAVPSVLAVFVQLHTLERVTAALPFGQVQRLAVLEKRGRERRGEGENEGKVKRFMMMLKTKELFLVLFQFSGW